MRRFRTACTVVSALALFAVACSPDAGTPPAPVTPSPAPAGPATAQVGYVCESGQAITVTYSDPDTVQLTYKGQGHVLRMVPSASGARYAGSGLEWWSASRDGSERATLSRLGPDQNFGTVVLERCRSPSSGPVMPAPVPEQPPAPEPLQSP